MNKNLVIVIIAGVLLLLMGLGLYFLLGDSTDTPPGTAPGTQFPSTGVNDPAGQGGGIEIKRAITAYDGTAIQARDFLADTDVATDVNIPGTYYLEGGVYADAATPYQIFFDDADDYFGITLYKEPLGANRRNAEEALMKRLGISDQDMCRLSYVIAPGPGVAETYEGANLGFSFCPGAVKLP